MRRDVRLPKGAEEQGLGGLLGDVVEQLQAAVVELAALLLEARQNRHDQAAQARAERGAEWQIVLLVEGQNHGLDLRGSMLEQREQAHAVDGEIGRQALGLQRGIQSVSE